MQNKDPMTSLRKHDELEHEREHEKAVADDPIPPQSPKSEPLEPAQSPSSQQGLIKAEQAPPEAPYSRFTRGQKWLILGLGAISATFSGFASNIYFPAIPTIASSLHTTVENINLTVTSYMIFQAITPTFWG